MANSNSMIQQVYSFKLCGAKWDVVKQRGLKIKGSLSLFFILALIPFVNAQRGGERVFEFIQLPISARATALGGSQIAATTNDYGLTGGNPAMLNSQMNRSVIFQHNFHFDGIGNMYAGYAGYLPALKSMIHGGIHYASYGKFIAADEFGNITGEFKARDIALEAGLSRQLTDRLNAGVLIRYIQSSLESYRSSGFAIDLGMTLASKSGLSHYAFALKGLGMQFNGYFEGDERGELPLDLQLGYSIRLKHVPFRFSVLMHDINRWDLGYESPLDDGSGPIIGEPTREPSGFGKQVDLFFRHITLGGEFIIGKKEFLMLRLGYNHQLKRELSVVNLRSLAGFSAGVGVDFKKFVLDYGLAVYHQAGSSKHIGLRIPFEAWKPKQLIGTD